MKDDLIAGSKLTLFAEYEEIHYFNSSQARDQEYIGQSAIGGYLIGFLPAISGVSKASSLYFYGNTRRGTRFLPDGASQPPIIIWISLPLLRQARSAIRKPARPISRKPTSPAPSMTGLS